MQQDGIVTRRQLVTLGVASAALVLAERDAAAWITQSPSRPFVDVTRVVVDQQGNTLVGATGDGVTDDTAAVQDAFNSVPASGGTVFFPPGEYRLTGTITCSNPVNVVGSGRRITRLVWAAVSQGVGFDFAFSGAYTLTMRSLSLLTSLAGGAYALSASWPQETFSSADLQDVHIGPVRPDDSPATQWWGGGIRLTNATTARISHFAIHGATNTTNMLSAIELRGYCRPVYISNGDIFSVAYGVYQPHVGNAASEGIHVSHVEMAYVTKGVWLWPYLPHPGTTIDGCHIAASAIAIELTDCTDFAVSGNLLYRGYPATPFAGIYLIRNSRCRIVANEIIDTVGNTADNGIILDSCQQCVVNSNVIHSMNTGVWVAGGAYNMVLGNRILYSSYTALLDQSSGLIAAYNG